MSAGTGPGTGLGTSPDQNVRGPDRSLLAYISELVSRLGAGDPAAADRLREVVGDRRARIGLDDVTVLVAFDRAGGLRIVEVTDPDGPAGAAVDGTGSTTHPVVLDLLAGRREVADAVLDGDIEIRGHADAVAALFSAVDILLEAAARLPALRELADEYVAAHRRAPSPSDLPPPSTTRRGWPPDLHDAVEEALLYRWGLRHRPPSPSV